SGSPPEAALTYRKVGLASLGASTGDARVSRGLLLPRPARRRGGETFEASPTHVGAVPESCSDRGSIPRASIKTGNVPRHVSRFFLLRPPTGQRPQLTAGRHDELWRDRERHAVGLGRRRRGHGKRFDRAPETTR